MRRTRERRARRTRRSKNDDSVKRARRKGGSKSNSKRKGKSKRKMNEYMRTMNAARKKGLASFSYKGKTFRQTKNPNIYKGA